MNWILLTNLLILAVLSGGFIAASLFIHSISKGFQDFTSYPDGDEPSPLFVVLARLSAVLAQQIATQVKTTLMGMLSGQARGEQALNNAEAQLDLALDNPAAAGIIEMLPKNIKKMAYKNPAIAKLVMNKIAGMTQPVGGGTTASGNGSKAKFNL